MANPKEFVGEAVRRLVQNWDDGTSQNAIPSDQLMKEICSINSADFIIQLALQAASNWTVNHTKSINCCLTFYPTDWFCPVVTKYKESPEFKKLVLWTCEQISLSAEIPMLSDCERYDDDKTDFPFCAEKSTYFMLFCSKFIKLLDDLNETLLLKDVLKSTIKYALVSVCCNCGDFPWTNSRSIQAAIDLKHVLFHILDCGSLKEVLLRGSDCVSHKDRQHDVLTKDSILKQVLFYLRPNLSKGKWKQNPSNLKSFVTCLFSIDLPHLSEYLGDFLPVALMLVDDYIKDNKRLGVQCLSHIIENTSRTDLAWQSRADVIFEAVKLQLYSKEVPLLEDAIPCMLAILKVLAPSTCDQGKLESVIFQGPSKYDEIFHMILFNAEMESLLVLRRVYTRHLDRFIKCMGVNVVKHSKKLLHLVESYLETSDGPSETARFNTLLILNGFIYQAWPRVSGHSAVILKSLLRLAYDISVDSSLTPDSVKLELMEKAKESLLLLKSVCSEDVNKCLRLMLDIETTPRYKQFLQEVLGA